MGYFPSTPFPNLNSSSMVNKHLTCKEKSTSKRTDPRRNYYLRTNKSRRHTFEPTSHMHSFIHHELNVEYAVHFLIWRWDCWNEALLWFTGVQASWLPFDDVVSLDKPPPIYHWKDLFVLWILSPGIVFGFLVCTLLIFCGYFGIDIWL